MEEETDDKSDAVARDLRPRRIMSIWKREEVRRLLFEGMSGRKVAKRMGVSQSVISRLHKKLQETGKVEDRHRVGRPRLPHQHSEHWTQLNGDYKFQCNHCERLFVQHARIREHLRTHTGERPFKCDQCCRAFATAGTLKRHLVKHTDRRPFMCDICGKQFADNGSLRIHNRVHTGDKPYKCTHCKQSCITQGNLNVHMRVHRKLIKTSGRGGQSRDGQRWKKRMALLHNSEQEASFDNKADRKDVMVDDKC